MRSLLFVLCCSVALLLPTTTQAKSLWELLSLFHRFIPTSALPGKYPPDPYMLAHDHEMFAWYDPACCSNHDCKAFDSSVVTERSDGSVSVHHIDPFYGEMDIVFDAKKFRRRPPGTPADPYWHLCFQVFEDTTTFESVVRTYCMYRPDASM